MTLIPSDDVIVQGIVEMMKYFGWDSIAIITQEEDIFAYVCIVSLNVVYNLQSSINYVIICLYMQTRNALVDELAKNNLGEVQASFSSNHSPQDALKKILVTDLHKLFCKVYACTYIYISSL